VLLSVAGAFEQLAVLVASNATASAVTVEPESGSSILSVDDAQDPVTKALAWDGESVDVIEGQWLVRFSAEALGGQTVSSQAGFDDSSGLQVRDLTDQGIALITGANVDVDVMTQWAEQQTDILYVEPDFVFQSAVAPNDSGYSNLWGLNNTGQSGGTADADIDAPEAWELTTGSSDVVIGVIDTGIDYNHVDLAANIWTNPGEIAGDGIDNDGNGYIDDIHGWDFVNDDNDPMDDHNHGTHVAGTIGAVGNNSTGVVGVNWDVSMIALKFLSASGSGSLSDAVDAINYATMLKRDYGVNIVATNNSWGGGGFSSSLRDAIAASGDQDILFVAAAGNDSNDNDASPSYPATYDLDNVISVASTTRNDQLSSFSNYGNETVHIGAPGSSIYSTLPGNSYGTFSGTSMATPHVAGVVALLAAHDADATAAEIKNAILLGADSTAATSGTTITGKRLNALGALNMLGVTGPMLMSVDPTGDAAPTNEINVRFSGAVDAATVSTGSFDLRHNGADNVFGTADDGVINIQPSELSIVAADHVRITLGSQLAIEEYRLTIAGTGASAIMDSDGNALNAGSDVERFFNITSAQGPYELNDTIATATDTGLSGAGTVTMSGFVGDGYYGARDVDLFKVEAGAGDKIIADVDAYLIGTGLDPVLRLFDAVGNQLAVNDDAHFLDSYIELTVALAGFYYVGVTGYSDFSYDPNEPNSGTPGDTGAYNLHLTIESNNAAPTIISDGGGSAAALVVDENQTAVTTVNATDADGDTITYSITSGADAALFSIDSSTGVLTFNSAPDFENPTDANANGVYEVQVTASDGNGGTDTQFIGVTISDVNEQPTIGSASVATVDENQTAVMTVSANDPDGDTLSYQITGGADASLFSINSATGVLTFTSARDFETPTDANTDGTYEVQVTASDGSGGSDAELISVTIADVNEQPTISSSTSVNADENQTSVMTVTASDPDGDTVTYQITGGADASLFSINDATGVLIFTSAPDFETPTDGDTDGTYEVQITTSDGNGGTDAQLISVTVSNVNESPAITSNGGGVAAHLSVPDKQVSVTTVSADDPDGDSLTYQITGGVDAALFTIDGATGVLTFAAEPDFVNPTDANSDGTYVVQVAASDGNGGSDTQVINVTVSSTNLSPVITSNGGADTANVNIDENSMAVTTVQATDPDGDSLTYQIAGGADAALFTLNSGTGVLAFISAPNFEVPTDSDSDSVYEIQVAASDGKFGTDTQLIRVTVDNLDEAPTITSAASVNAAENQTAVTTIQATDPNGDAITYTITGGDDAALFSLNSTSGVLTFVSSRNFETPTDADGNGTYEVQVTAADGVDGTDSQLIVVTVTDVNELPTITSGNGGATATVIANENQTFATTVTAADPDGDTITYSIGGGVDANLFAINSTTGVLTFIAPPDFETPADSNANGVYVVQVVASDSVSGSDAQLISMTVADVNDDPTITSAAAHSVDENQATVATVTASDPDSDALTYQITGGADAWLFTLDSSTGVLAFTSARDFENPIDDGFDGTYEVQVTASDGNGGSNQQLISVTVENVNELPSFISAAAFGADENQTAIATVSAIDPDGDALTYQITGGADASLFSLNSSTGALTFISAPNFEAPADADLDGDYEVQITASDGNGGSDQQLVSVTVRDINELPTITSTASVNADENQASVTTVSGTDPDGDVLAYQITGGADASLFTLNTVTGVLAFTSARDFETPTDADTDGIYEVQIAASDGNGGVADQLLSVTVQNVNEQPTITSAASVSVDENQTSVTIVDATDPDGDVVTYQITGGADASLFTLNSTTGVLTFTSSRDFETPTDADTDGTYEVQITASDNIDGSDTQLVSVTVDNVNETPTITSIAEVTVNENETAVTTVSATDPDGDAVTYQITGGDDASLFTLDSTTGALAFTAARDFELPVDADADGTYEVQVTASDNNGGTDSQSIRVTVNDVNEAPTLTSIHSNISPVLIGEDIVLSSTGVWDADGNVSAVHYYRESNGQDGLQQGDTLLGSDSDLSGNRGIDFDTTGLSEGGHVFYAQVEDEQGLLSDAAQMSIAFHAPAFVAGTTWRDDNADGVRNENEPGLANVTVYLDANNNGSLDDSEQSTVTSSTGAYSFTRLVAGDYVVRQIVPDGYDQTTPVDGYAVTLAAGDAIKNLDFGNFLPASVGNFVWHDLNGDGIQNNNEQPMAGVTVMLATGGDIVGTQVTDETGLYSFTNLPTGSYVLTFQPSAGFQLTQQDAGDDDALDSDPDPLTGQFSFTIQPGENLTDIDAGVVAAPVLGSLNLGTSNWLERVHGSLSGSFTDPDGQTHTHLVTIDWGDGSDATVLVLQPGVSAFESQYLYAQDGQYDITVHVTDGSNLTDSQTISHTVNSTVPVADSGGPYTINEGQFLQLNADASSDASGDALNYSWDLNNDQQFGDAVGVNPLLAWQTLNAFGLLNGTNNIAVMVTDQDGDTATASTTLTINNLPPTVQADVNAINVLQGDPIQNAGTYSDAGGDTVELAASLGTLIRLPGGLWTWQMDSSGLASGTHTVTVTATDSDGALSDVSFDVTVNIAPVSNAGGDYQINEGQALQLDGSASIDPDGHLFSYVWDLDGDGVYGDAVGATPTVTWQTLSDLGLPSDGTAVQIGLRVTDNGGASVDSTANLVINNVAPQLGLSDISLVHNVGVQRISLGAVDADQLAGTVTVQDPQQLAWNASQSLRLNRYYAQYDTLLGLDAKWILSSDNRFYLLFADGEIRQWAGSFATSPVVANVDAGYYADPQSLIDIAAPAALPANLVTFDNATGELVIDPTGFLGDVAVTLTVTDGLSQDTQTFNLSVTNAAPTVDVADQSISHTSGEQRIALPATDGDGDELTYTVTYQDPRQLAWEADQQFNFSNYYAVYDTLLGLDAKWILGNGGFYLLFDSGELRRWAGSYATSPVVANVGQAYYANPDALIDVTPPDVLPDNLVSVDQDTNELVINPIGFMGEAQVTVTVSDGLEQTSDTFNLTVSNSAPTIDIADQNLSHTAGTHRIALPATDVDGDQLTYTVSVADPRQLAWEADQQFNFSRYYSQYDTLLGLNAKWILGNGGFYLLFDNGDVRRWAGSYAASPVVANVGEAYYADPASLIDVSAPNALPANLVTYDQDTNELVINAAGFFGDALITVTVDDGVQQTTGTFNLSVSNLAPQVDIDDLVIGSDSQPIVIDLPATDGDGESVTYALNVQSPAALAYATKTQFGLSGYLSQYNNILGQNERWLQSTSGQLYLLLPGGALRRWAGAFASSPIVATVGDDYWQDPNTLINAAQASAVPDGVISFDDATRRLAINPQGYFGELRVELIATDGAQVTTTTFNVSIV